jgi:site-specific recombinase XerD
MSFKTLEEAVTDYLGQFTNADTARSYRQTLEPFVRDFGRSRPVSTFTPEDLSAWDATLKARGLASATIASNRRRMKAFWNWCVERDHG